VTADETLLRDVDPKGPTWLAVITWAHAIVEESKEALLWSMPEEKAQLIRGTARVGARLIDLHKQLTQPKGDPA
jgi:hypothetical protein